MFPLVESSFKRLIRSKPVRLDRSLVVETIKNIKAQSFEGADFFTHPIIDQSNQVKLKVNTFRNILDRDAWRKSCRLKYQYESLLTGVTIPLNIQGNDLYHKARLVIAWPAGFGQEQISIQFLLSREQTWVTVPCRTNTVCTTFYGLFPKEDGRFI